MKIPPHAVLYRQPQRQMRANGMLNWRRSGMTRTSRRAILKTGLAVSAGVLVPGRIVAGEPTTVLAVGSDPQLTPAHSALFASFAGSGSPRQRALSDFDWRFHFGNAADAMRDFGFGAPRRERTFAKAAFVAPVAESDFDDSTWRTLNLPHDWATELPFIGSDENPAPLSGCVPCRTNSVFTLEIPEPHH